MKSNKLHNNSLYNTPVAINKSVPFDYFEENQPKQEIQAFSQYCDSILNGMSVVENDSHKKEGNKNKLKKNKNNLVTKSLAQLSNNKEKFSKLKEFKSHDQKSKKENMSKEIDKNLLSSLNSEYSNKANEFEKLIQKNSPKKPKKDNQGYLRFSSKGREKKGVSIQNSFYIEHL
jgi:hypothetical protein